MGRKYVNMYALPLIVCRWEIGKKEVYQNICLLLIRNVWKYYGLMGWVCLFKLLQNMTHHHILGTPEWSWPKSIILVSIQIKFASNLAQKTVELVFLS